MAPAVPAPTPELSAGLALPPSARRLRDILSRLVTRMRRFGAHFVGAVSMGGRTVAHTGPPSLRSSSSSGVAASVGREDDSRALLEKSLLFATALHVGLSAARDQSSPAAARCASLRRAVDAAPDDGLAAELARRDRTIAELTAKVALLSAGSATGAPLAGGDPQRVDPPAQHDAGAVPRHFEATVKRALTRAKTATSALTFSVAKLSKSATSFLTKLVRRRDKLRAEWAIKKADENAQPIRAVVAEVSAFANAVDAGRASFVERGAAWRSWATRPIDLGGRSAVGISKEEAWAEGRALGEEWGEANDKGAATLLVLTESLARARAPPPKPPKPSASSRGGGDAASASGSHTEAGAAAMPSDDSDDKGFRAVFKTVGGRRVRVKRVKPPSALAIERRALKEARQRAEPAARAAAARATQGAAARAQTSADAGCASGEEDSPSSSDRPRPTAHLRSPPRRRLRLDPAAAPAPPLRAPNGIVNSANDCWILSSLQALRAVPRVAGASLPAPLGDIFQSISSPAPRRYIELLRETWRQLRSLLPRRTLGTQETAAECVVALARRIPGVGAATCIFEACTHAGCTFAKVEVIPGFTYPLAIMPPPPARPLWSLFDCRAFAQRTERVSGATCPVETGAHRGCRTRTTFWTDPSMVTVVELNRRTNAASNIKIRHRVSFLDVDVFSFRVPAAHANSFAEKFGNDHVGVHDGISFVSLRYNFARPWCTSATRCPRVTTWPTCARTATWARHPRTTCASGARTTRR